LYVEITFNFPEAFLASFIAASLDSAPLNVHLLIALCKLNVHKFNRSFGIEKSFLHVSFKSHNLVGPTFYAGLILILHAMYSLGLISIIEGIPAEKRKNATYSTRQISISILAEMIVGFENSNRCI
jgi:hypothetical protein